MFDVLAFVSACRVKHWPAHQHTCKRVARCAKCYKTDVPLRKCSRCHEAEYCSPGECMRERERARERESDARFPECQRVHWASHKATCKAEAKKEKEAEEAAKEPEAAVLLQCAKCSKTGESLLKCAACHIVRYCSVGTCVCEREVSVCDVLLCVCTECQRAHWTSHKAACKAARKAAKKDTVEKKEYWVAA